jgi:hypothetical protein
VFNLTVADVHTYYAGTTPVLVHNSGGPCPTPWQEYEAKYGGEQTPMQTVFNGEPVNVRLDAPVSEEGIIDFKDYNWANPRYQSPFIQDRVIEQFQSQILKYQTINPSVTLQFSQEPPQWVVSAVHGVGGRYTVAP